ncbi:MAG: VWA domain-containing protein [Deltaproteobacteria bacterium]|nr:VWA domain-containing protein [Deltaproteobacteria bacterium]MBN2673774.1 VWA domain-containing protein [Deltaproteobacteria bacterium]
MKHLFGLWVVFAFVFTGCPSEPPAPQKTLHLTSRVELSAGEVWMKLGESATRVMTGTMVEDGATLETQKGARALVRLHNGAGVFLRGTTTIEIAHDSVNVKAGELWADIPEDESKLARFDVGKVMVTAAGAGLDIMKDKNGVTVYVARGLAVVEAPKGRVEVSAGEQAVVKGDKPTLSPVAFFDDWTGGMADRPLRAGISGSASGKIYGIDRANPGSEPSELQIVSQQVQTIIRDGVAYTSVDQIFFNTASAPVEGWYWFTVPEGASVVRFAWEVNGQMVDGHVVERKQAAASYEAAVERAIDPALLEWIDGRTFRARIFPVPATGRKRIVLGYTELLPLSDGAYRYVYPMAGEDAVQIQEFSLQVNLGDAGKEYKISTLQDAKVEQDKRLVSMRRSGFTPRSDFLLELQPKQKQTPLQVMRYKTGANEADYVMLRYAPEVDWQEIKEVPGDVVVVLDTSAGGDTAEYQIRIQTAEAILRALAETDHFAVMSTDLTPRVVFPQKGMSDAGVANINAAVEKMAQIQPAGASDLGEMFSAALSLVHDAPQPAIVYVGDGLATSGETSSDALTERLRRTMGNSKARLFTIAVGADADHSLLERLAAVGGGQMYRIDLPEQIVQESLRFAGQLKTPTITELSIDVGAGLDQVFTNRQGKVSEGEEVVLLARTHHQLPGQVTVTGALAGETFTQKYTFSTETGAAYSYIPSLWARMYLARLMGRGLTENHGKIISLGLNYGLMTPFTSFLVLENEVLQNVPAHQNPYRLWTMNIDRDESQGMGAKEAFSIPLFGFGCSEYDAREAPATTVEAQDQPLKYMGDREEAAAEKGMSEGNAMSAPSAPMTTKDMPMADEAVEPEEVAKMEMVKSAPMKKRASSSGAGALDDLLGGVGIGSGGGKGQRLEEDKAPALVAVDGDAERRPKSAQKTNTFSLTVCSDVASRPLSERRVLWQRRLQMVSDADGLLRVYKEAGERCELKSFKDRKTLLNLIADRVFTAKEVKRLLSVFDPYTQEQNHLRRRIARTFLDGDATMGLYVGSQVNWRAVQTGLAALDSPEARLEEMRKVVKSHPDAPEAQAMLVHVLVENRLSDEAERVAKRLHQNGDAPPDVLIVLCDLQAQRGEDEAARRVCSELVEFNAQSVDARRKLGDLFLRHGWYADAYRQYATLVEVQEDAVSLLRLSIAAAGMGKIDEALRIARKVSTGDGEPGSDDPRQWAMALSVARIAAMMHEANEKGDKKMLNALSRQMKRTGLFTSKKTVELLVWEDLEVALSLRLFGPDNALLNPLATIPGIAVGVELLEMSSDVTPTYDAKISGKNIFRPVQAQRIRVTYDGKDFTIHTESLNAASSAENGFADASAG